MRSVKPLLVAAVLAAAAVPARGQPPAVPPVVGTSWLAERLSEPGIVILDARPSLREYVASHLPGAQPLAVENLRSCAGGVPGTLFPPLFLEGILGRLGIGPGSRVVVYAGGSDPDATYVASVVGIAGVERVSVLDGGFERWTREGRPVTAERRVVRAAARRPTPGTREVASLEEVRRAFELRTAVLVDARPPEQFEAGRIPRSVSRFWKLDVVPDGSPDAGLFRDARELEREYAALGVTREKPVIVYCNSGHMASSVYYTLRYRLGYPNTKLYDGSWLEWSMVPGLPIESGPARAKQGTAGAPRPTGESAPPEALDGARRAADALTGALQKRLMAELQSGGPKQAVRVCSEIAQETAASFSAGGTSVRRTSLRTRNPANAPDPFEAAWLEKLEGRLKRGALPGEVAEVTLEDGKRFLRYLRPIVAGDRCLACHGPADRLDGEVRALLSQRYPQDRATGYAAGDLRGAVSVRVPLDAAP